MLLKYYIPPDGPEQKLEEEDAGHRRMVRQDRPLRVAKVLLLQPASAKAED
jgi:hypothetical protein